MFQEGHFSGYQLGRNLAIGKVSSSLLPVNQADVWITVFPGAEASREAPTSEHVSSAANTALAVCVII